MLHDELQPDFVIGNMATDLVDLTLEFCNKEDGKPPRFPKNMYNSFVTELVNLALEIQHNVCVANSNRVDAKDRAKLQGDAMGDCVCLEKDVFVAYRRGWISAKQFLRWQKLICNLHWKIFNWSNM